LGTNAKDAGGISGVNAMADYSKKLIDFFGRKGVFIQTSMPTSEEAVELGEKLHAIMSL
jgi:hypothetical protein